MKPEKVSTSLHAPQPGLDVDASLAVIDAHDLRRLLGVTFPTFRKLIAAGKLPRPMILGNRTRLFWVSEVREFMEATRQH